ncbi:MAG: restriction endonuclease [Eubacteriales bacterium]
MVIEIIFFSLCGLFVLFGIYVTIKSVRKEKSKENLEKAKEEQTKENDGIENLKIVKENKYNEQIENCKRSVKIIDECIEEFFGNEDIKVICKNFALKNNIFEDIMEYSFIPYFIGENDQVCFTPEINELKNSTYKKFISNLTNTYILDKSNDIRYFSPFGTLNSELYPKNNEAYVIFMHTKELFEALISQNLISCENKNEKYRAFLFLIYYYDKLKFYDYLKSDIETYKVNIDAPVEDIVKLYFDLNYSSGLIATRISSIISSKNDFAEVFGIEFPRIQKQVEEIITNLKQSKMIEELKQGTNKSFLLSEKDINSMNGTEFEDFVAKIFEAKGYRTHVTAKSGDQGIDVIAEKADLKIAIQTKCYSGSVGNHAVMEAAAGAKYYGADKCMVITNSKFTQKAQELASANKVELWDGDRLRKEYAQL